MSAVATWDALRLISGIDEATSARSQEGGATEQEVHALAYLACVLSHWRSTDLDWGYAFHSTERAEPFAPELSAALQSLRANGMVRDNKGVLGLTAYGDAFMRRLKSQSLVVSRDPFLGAALESPSLLPIPMVLRALDLDPTIAATATRQLLLDETALHVLDEYRVALETTTGGTATLSTLIEVWLRYLLVAGKAAA